MTVTNGRGCSRGSDTPRLQRLKRGDPDVLVRLRVRDVDHLQRVVNAIRRTGKVTGTKTLIVMYDWTRGHSVDAPRKTESNSG